MLRENITYSAFPLEKEREPFLEAVSQINDHNPLVSEPIQKALDHLKIPVRLTLYIALQCPHCPNVVRTVMALASHTSTITLHVIDGSLFLEAAQKDRVMSAPCLILDDDFRWTGSVSMDEIVQMITSRDPSRLSTQTLKDIIEQGNAAWIAQQMVKQKKIFEAFIPLLLHETWSVRLGAMVAVEALAETGPDIAALLCPFLIDRFDEKEIPIQGDILYALGEAGDDKTKEWLEKKLSELEHPDLIDAAQEAMDTLELKAKSN